MRRAFTLMELLVVIVIIGILSALMLGALSRAGTTAKVQSTKSRVLKLAQEIEGRVESYRTRRLPIDAGAQLANPYVQNQLAAMVSRRGMGASDPLNPPYTPDNYQQIAAVRLLAMRELMRLELPQRIDDFIANPSLATNAPPNAPPAYTGIIGGGGQNATAASESYRRHYNRTASRYDPQYEAAECLHLILSIAVDDEGFDVRIQDTGDRDEDGLREFHDAWGNPIAFLRWAPGFISEVQPNPTLPDPLTFTHGHRDPFDNLSLDLPASSGAPRGFHLTPLVYSTGPDERQDVWGRNAIPSGMTPLQVTVMLNDPYYDPSTLSPPGLFPGTQLDPATPVPPGNQPGESRYTDNIHSHTIEIGRR